MAANLEWDIPFTLTTPFSGTPLALNAVGAGPRYIVDRSSAVMGPGLASQTAIRRARDMIPQASGEIKHIRGFKPGYEFTIPLLLYTGLSDAAGDVEVVPACGADLVDMGDLLMGHCEALLDGEGRISWQPSARGTTVPDQRMLDKISLLSWPVPSASEDDGLIEVTFEVFTAFPYALNLTPGSPAAFGAGAAALTNVGTSRTYPVFRVHGPASTFTLTNTSVLDSAGNPLEILYNAGLPGGVAIGGGDYAEIDTFRNTIYLNGDGANLKAALDVTVSEFFWLKPGLNSLTITGDTTTADILWNSAWA